MLRVIVYLFGAFLGSAVLVFSLESYLAETIAKQVVTGKLRERFRPIFIMVEDQTQNGRSPQIEAEFARITKRFQYPALLLTTAHATTKHALRKTELALLDNNQILVFERESSVTFLKQLGDSDWIMALEPQGLQQPYYLKMRFYYGIQAILLLIAVLLLAQWFWRDLRKMKTATRQIASGQFQVRTALSRQSLLHPLAIDFDTMACQLEALMASHRELVSAVSHEIRSPLSRMHFHYHMAMDARDEEERAEQMLQLEFAMDELDVLTDEILTYAKLKQVDPSKPHVSVDAVELLDAAIEHARFEKERAGYLVNIQVETSLLTHNELSGIGHLLHRDTNYLSSDGIQESSPRLDITIAINVSHVFAITHLMERAIKNLLGNAMRHAVSKVRVEVTSVGGDWVVHVDDDGAGIPVWDRQRIFEPFVRVDNSRSRDTGGYGIGLAIVSRVAHWHRGHVSVSDSPLGGARFTMRWPSQKENSND